MKSFVGSTLCGLLMIAVAGGAQTTAESPDRGFDSTFTGDTFSFDHQLGALIDGVFQCFSEQYSGMEDNTVLFDGLSEFLDPYIDGTQPLVFEFETSTRGPGSTATILSFLDTGTDLFPEGFNDPATGTPLTDACVEIGIDDTLDAAEPQSVVSATIAFFSGASTVLPPVEVSSALSDPFDGRLSIVFPDFAGLDIDSVEVVIQTQSAGNIFADGFESGDTAAWTSQVP